jgi:hypothetical protein
MFRTMAQQFGAITVKTRIGSQKYCMRGKLTLNFLNLGTYLPRQCGIATFSRDLRDNLTRLGEKTSIAAISDPYLHTPIQMR